MDTAFTHLLGCAISPIPVGRKASFTGCPTCFCSRFHHSYRAIHSFIDVHLHRLKQTLG